jgi:glycine betaine/proline transport system substrate-binding protein
MTFPKPDRRLEIGLWVVVYVALALVGSFVIRPAAQDEGQREVVRIGYVSWAEGIAMTYLAQSILEDEMNYRVELTMADPAPIFTSLAGGELDLFLDAWLPITHKNYMDKYGETLLNLGMVYKDARIGLVTPQYAETGTIPELKNHAKRYGGKITGIDSGAGIMEATERAIEAYSLPMELVSSSGAAMTASLKDALRAKEPIVVTGWKPHWMFARFELKFLNDPKKVYGEAENIHAIARPGLNEDLPEVAAFVSSMAFTDQQIGSLMDRMNTFASPQEAARNWKADHQKLIESWLSR